MHRFFVQYSALHFTGIGCPLPFANLADPTALPEHPLAQNFNLTDGSVKITVPNVPPRDNYFIVCKFVSQTLLSSSSLIFTFLQWWETPATQARNLLSQPPPLRGLAHRLWSHRHRLQVAQLWLRVLLRVSRRQVELCPSIPWSIWALRLFLSAWLSWSCLSWFNAILFGNERWR